MPPTILIIEDSDLGGQLVEVLEMEGFIGIRAMNAKEAMRLAQEHYPDLIITDLMLPEVNGVEFIRRVHEMPALAHIPVIMMSAAVDHRDEALEAGALIFLAKPFMNAEFLGAIQQALSG